MVMRPLAAALIGAAGILGAQSVAVEALPLNPVLTSPLTSLVSPDDVVRVFGRYHRHKSRHHRRWREVEPAAPAKPAPPVKRAPPRMSSGPQYSGGCWWHTLSPRYRPCY